MFGTGACWNNAPDYPFSEPQEEFDEQYRAFRERRERLWGTKELAKEFIAASFAPPLVNDEPKVAWLADYMRNAASPGAVNAFSAMNQSIDVRSALPAIHVPTLVMAREGDLDWPAEETKWLAGQIRDVRYVEFPGDEHYIFLGRSGCAARRDRTVRGGGSYRGG